LGSQQAEQQLHILTLAQATKDLFLGVNLSRRVRPDPATARVRIVHVKDVVDGLLVPRANLEEIAPETFPRGRYFLEKSDVIVTARGSLLRCALVSEEHAGVLPSSNLIVVRPGAVLRAELILAFLRHPRTQADLLLQTVGAIVPTLKLRSVANLRIAVPAVEEQHDLARLIALGETQYVAAHDAARLRRELALELVMRRLESA
jgi:hypothetical protein